MPFVGLVPVVRNEKTSVTKNGETPVEKPMCIENMICICKKLSKNIPFSRIDLYVIDDKEYFGEITFFPASGIGWFIPEEWNYTFGSWIKLPQK